MIAARSDRRRWLFRATAIICGLVVGLLLVEGAIRLFPKLLSSDLRHAAFSRYDTLPGGIFLSEGITRMRFMRADFSTRAYSHGYRWTHSTDEHGFRNPTGQMDRRVLLLGDSLVYGHGVERDETVAHFLRADHGVPAYDLSAQGYSLYNHYVLARLLLEELRPDVVLLFVYLNDVHDLEVARRLDLSPEMQEIGAFDYELIGERVAQLHNWREPWPVRAAFASSVVRMAAKTGGWRPPRPPPSSPPIHWRSMAARLPPGTDGHGAKVGVAAAVLDDDRFKPVEGYYDLVLGDLAGRCDDLGAELILIHLAPPVERSRPKRDRAQAKLQGSLEVLAANHGLELVDTTALFAGQTDWILAGDGHLNPNGNRELAAFIKRGVLPTPVRGGRAAIPPR